MPRLRRVTLQRREKPELNAELYEWVTGEKTYEELSVPAKWHRMILETGLRTSEDFRKFWSAVRSGVESGAIEISRDKVHKMSDPPLLGESQ
jgi:hypothetical protein